MTSTNPHRRRYLIAGAIMLALGAGSVALVSNFSALGPIAGTIAPQMYVDSLPNARIPVRGRFVLVDANSARLYMLEDGRVRDSMRVIVGKPETPTPALHSVISYSTLNPYWHVTSDLAQSIIAPRVLKEGYPYLTDRGYEVVTAFGPTGRVIPFETVDWPAVAAGTTRILVRQRPGPANSLGQYKFFLPDTDGIYLHDTPKKELFAQNARALSHGCVRLEDAPRLARWLIGGEPPAATRPDQHILLPKSVPITISYLDNASQTRLAALH